MALLQARFNEVDLQIADVQEQIEKLQQTLSDLQAHRQNLQSVEQAAESALSQIETALMMINHVDSSQISTFKSAIDAKFNEEIIAQLPAAPEEPEPEVIVTDDPEPNNDGDGEVVDVVDATPSEVVEPEVEPSPEADAQADMAEVEEEDSTPAPQPVSNNGFKSAGSAVFDPSKATMSELKDYVLARRDRRFAKNFGSLTRRNTWIDAAQEILYMGGN